MAGPPGRAFTAAISNGVGFGRPTRGSINLKHTNLPETE